MYVEILQSSKDRDAAYHSEHYAKELDKINDLLNKFAYSCSHSLKGPIVTIQGLLGLLEMECHNLPQVDYLREMQHWAEKMKTRVNRLDDYQFNPRYKLAEKLYCTMYPSSVMESKEHLLRQFIYGVLNLTDLVDNFRDLIESKLLICAHPQELKYLQLIKSKLLNIQNFILAVENFSRNRGDNIRKVEIDMEDLTRQVVDEVTFECMKDPIDMNVYVEQDQILIGDPVRLRIILKHLLCNAVYFHEPLRNNPYVEIVVKVTGEDLLVEVIDNGQGIIPECQSKIFDIFYRASEASQGCGLGLFLVKEVADRMKGELKFFSQVGIGSIFMLKMPNYLLEKSLPTEVESTESNTGIPVLKIA